MSQMFFFFICDPYLMCFLRQFEFYKPIIIQVRPSSKMTLVGQGMSQQSHNSVQKTLSSLTSIDLGFRAPAAVFEELFWLMTKQSHWHWLHDTCRIETRAAKCSIWLTSFNTTCDWLLPLEGCRLFTQSDAGRIYYMM